MEAKEGELKAEAVAWEAAASAQEARTAPAAAAAAAADGRRQQRLGRGHERGRRRRGETNQLACHGRAMDGYANILARSSSATLKRIDFAGECHHLCLVRALHA